MRDQLQAAATELGLNLSDTQLDQLAQKVLHMHDPGGHARGQAIGALGAVLARLGENRRNEVLDAATQLNDVDKCLAIRGLGAGLASLTTEQRQTLVEDTLNLPDIPEKALAIAGLAAAAAHLGLDLGEAREHGVDVAGADRLALLEHVAEQALRGRDLRVEVDEQLGFEGGAHEASFRRDG